MTLRQHHPKMEAVCSAMGYPFDPDWSLLEQLYSMGLLVVVESPQGLALWQLSQLLHDQKHHVALQVILWEPPGPRRGERYIHLLRKSEKVLAQFQVNSILGVAKSPPLGGLDPVFRRVGWTPEEQSYRKDLTPRLGQ